MPRISQVSLTGGEVSPSLFARVDLARYAVSLRTCRNAFVRPTGGVSNRAGLQFVYELNADSLATLVPFVFSMTQAYMLVFQDMTVQVYADGAYIPNASSVAISDIDVLLVLPYNTATVTTSGAHGLSPGMSVTISGVVGSGAYRLSGPYQVSTVPDGTHFTVKRIGSVPTGSYTSGGIVTQDVQIVTEYASDELADIRYTQSADVLTLVHQAHPPSEFVRVAIGTFTFDDISDFKGGPFLDVNTSTITMKSSAAVGTGITITASSSVFKPGHVGGLVRIEMQDLSSIPPWEPLKLIAASGANPFNLLRRSDGKVYRCATNEAATDEGTFTGTVPPHHDEGIESDGDGSAIPDTAKRAGVAWEYLHSQYGTARITAQAGTTATADILDYMPVVHPATSKLWSLGGFSSDQGYPALVTYYQDRLVFANTPARPQTRWASKTGDYHNFSKSSPQVADDAITETLNARQINAILELIPMDQLISLTASGSWSSPRRGEAWTPTTIGFDPQSFDGAAFLPSILIGESALFVQSGRTKVSDLGYATDRDKFRGDELGVLARHLFGIGRRIVDLAYAKEPHGILWIVREDGALIGLTYLKEQDVIGWHRHDTQGFFERVCVIPENDISVPYFVVRREVNGAAVRYLERMAERDRDDPLDGFFVDSGLTYDGRNISSTTVRIVGASYEGGDTVTVVASAALFAFDDLGDAIQLPAYGVRVRIDTFTDSKHIVGTLLSPVPLEIRDFDTVQWTFARDTFDGLDHLEGEMVAICADGSVEAQQRVTDGQVQLDYPAGVVHIGLPYVTDIETLEVTIFGASENIRSRAKRIPRVSIEVERSLGLKAGRADDLNDVGLQPSDFDFNQPWPLQSEVQSTYVTGSWNESGRVLLRQDNPLPLTVLSITPEIVVGEA